LLFDITAIENSGRRKDRYSHTHSANGLRLGFCGTTASRKSAASTVDVDKPACDRWAVAGLTIMIREND
jgi:hypothetical protein